MSVQTFFEHSYYPEQYKKQDTYDIGTSKERLENDISNLRKIHNVSTQVFFNGNVVLPVSIARAYNKFICRIHLILEDPEHNLEQFPNVQTHAKNLFTAHKTAKIFQGDNETARILNSLHTNFEDTLSAFSRCIEEKNVKTENIINAVVASL